MLHGPRYADPDRVRLLKPSSQEQYRRGAEQFVAYLDEEDLHPDSVESWDDILVEWSYTGIRLTTFRLAVAAVEMVYPRLKPGLVWARTRLSNLEALYPSRHTEPAGREICLLLAAQMAANRRARLGVGILFQNVLGLRPSEMLGLCGHDLRDSPEVPGRVIVRLGGRVGTKIGREQFAIFDSSKWSSLWSVMTIVIATTPPNCRLVLYSLPTLASWLKQAQDQLRLQLRITPHSPRSGFVCDELLAGTPAAEIRSRGRWSSESSFKRYVDIVGALHAAQALRVAGYGSAISWISAHLDEYFNQASLNVYAGQSRLAGPRPHVAQAYAVPGQGSSARRAASTARRTGTSTSPNARRRGRSGTTGKPGR